MQPALILVPSRGCTARSGPALLIICGNELATNGGMWRTTKTGALKSPGRAETTSLSVSTPPAEAPMAMHRWDISVTFRHLIPAQPPVEKWIIIHNAVRQAAASQSGFGMLTDDPIAR